MKQSRGQRSGGSKVRVEEKRTEEQTDGGTDTADIITFLASARSVINQRGHSC